MKKILVISYYWPPCGGPGVQRTLKFVRYLPHFGYLPYVITVDAGKASYPVTDESLLKDIPADIPVFRTDTSEPFTLYSKVSRKKNIPHSGFAGEQKPNIIQKLGRFVRGNLFIPDARLGWNKYAYRQAKMLLEKESFSAIYTSSPPHSTQLVGLRLKQETGLPWIADLRDPWTDIYYYKDMLHLPFAKRKDARYEKAVLENADEILVVSDAIRKIFSDKSDKIKPARFHVIPNGFDDDDFIHASQPPQHEFLITYTGTLAANYGVENFMLSLAAIIASNKEINIRLRFVGETGASVKELIKEAGIDGNVEYLAYVPHGQSVRYLLQSTALLLAIPRITNNEGILTGKLFEYLASRKPILCIGPANGDAAKIISDCEAGITFGYEEKETITSYLQGLINNWKVNPALDRTNETHLKYSRKKQAEELGNIIDSLL